MTVYWIYLFIGFYLLVPFLSVLVSSTCGRLSWPALWSMFGRTLKQYWLTDWLKRRRWVLKAWPEFFWITRRFRPVRRNANSLQYSYTDVRFRRFTVTRLWSDCLAVVSHKISLETKANLQIGRRLISIDFLFPFHHGHDTWTGLGGMSYYFLKQRERLVLSLYFLEGWGVEINIVATRCQILRIKFTKFDFGWRFAPDFAGIGHGGTCPHFYKWLCTGAPWVGEQQTRNWPNCTDRHESGE